MSTTTGTSEPLLTGPQSNGASNGDGPPHADGHAPRSSANTLRHILRAAREHLDMDLAYLTEFVDGEQRFHSIDGDAQPFGFDLDTAIPLEETYCDRMVRGLLDDVIPDTSEDDVVRDLDVTTDSGMRAYVAAPIRLPDGRLYGTVCCASQLPKAGLGEADARLLRAMAEVIAAIVHRESPSDAPSVSIRRRIIGCLRERALDIHFQPIIDLRDGRVVSVEALSRFPDEPHQGPHVWFADAARVGLGTELEALAIDRALEEAERLPADVSLALNASADLVLNEEITSLIADGRVPVDRIIIEITEHAAASDRDAIKARLAGLKEEGLRIAIDDAGSGFASLENVVDFAPDIVKADMSLVRGVATDPARRALLSALVSFARETDRTITAEGIEDRETLETLRRLGVDHGQGWLFAPAAPLPLERLRYDIDRLASRAVTEPGRR